MSEASSNWGQLSGGMVYDYDAGKIVGEMRVEDLAWALAGLNRYFGWTKIHWSVAAHACLVAEIIAALSAYDYATILLGLHHDDHEALIGDATQPFKQSWSEAMRAEFQHHARKADVAIFRSIGIWQVVQMDAGDARRGVVKAADLAALEAERLWLFPERMTWATEKIVSPQMLDAGQRILRGDFSKITGGKLAADRFVSHHRALLSRMGVAR